MSLERRQFDARSRVTALPPTEILPVVVEWDEKASHRAIMQAQTIASRDPEASQYLAGQVLAQPTSPAVNVYNPPAIYAEMLMVAKLKPWEIDKMHYIHFFGLRREIILFTECQRDALADQQAETNLSSDF